MLIATKHTGRKCKYCKTPIFIGCAFYGLGNKKYICERCIDSAVTYLTINLILNKGQV